ncbi:hypothetical protein QE152_g964 [Popillia japonica]|uniref:Reverse transcriptase n=1 Tax=Popillia japonica TaxID=7064 RepID=A0AAW1NA43_POPJA
MKLADMPDMESEKFGYVDDWVVATRSTSLEDIEDILIPISGSGNCNQIHLNQRHAWAIVSSAKFVTQTKEALFSGLGVVLSVANCWNNIQIERTSVESWIGRLNQLGWFCQNWLKQDLHPSLSHGSIIVAILALKMDDSD